MYKGHMDKAKGEQDQGREVRMAGVGGEWRQLYLKNNLKMWKIKNENTGVGLEQEMVI